MAVVKSPKNIGRKLKWVKVSTNKLKTKTNLSLTSKEINNLSHIPIFSWKKRHATKSKLKKDIVGLLSVSIT